MPGASIIGAGAGVPAHAGIHAELIPNLHLATGTQKSKWVAVNKDGKPIQVCTHTHDAQVLHCAQLVPHSMVLPHAHMCIRGTTG